MLSEELFVSHQRVSGFPEKGADLQGSSAELPGKSGKLLGNLWSAVMFHGERTSGEVAGELREPDFLPAIHQICLQCWSRLKTEALSTPFAIDCVGERCARELGKGMSILEDVGPLGVRTRPPPSDQQISGRHLKF